MLSLPLCLILPYGKNQTDLNHQCHCFYPVHPDLICQSSCSELMQNGLKCSFILPLTGHAFYFAQCNSPQPQTCCVHTLAPLVTPCPAVVPAPLCAHETIAHIGFITDTCFITRPFGSWLHTPEHSHVLLFLQVFYVKFSAIRAFSISAFELDFVRSSSFSLSSQPVKAQSSYCQL